LRHHEPSPQGFAFRNALRPSPDRARLAPRRLERKTVVGTSQANDGALGLAVDDRYVYWRGGTRLYAAPR
jgi:hypothetical protein